MPIISKSSTNIIGYWLHLFRSSIAIFIILLLYYLYLYRHETIQMCVEMLNEYNTVETGILFYVDIRATAIISFIYIFYDKNYVL